MDSGPGEDSIERIGEEAHLGCAEDPDLAMPLEDWEGSCIASSWLDVTCKPCYPVSSLNHHSATNE